MRGGDDGQRGAAGEDVGQVAAPVRLLVDEDDDRRVEVGGQPLEDRGHRLQAARGRHEGDHVTGSARWAGLLLRHTATVPRRLRRAVNSAPRALLATGPDRRRRAAGLAAGGGPRTRARRPRTARARRGRARGRRRPDRRRPRGARRWPSRSARGPGARDEPGDVPRDGAGADVLEVVPDQPVVGAQQIRHRGVAMEGLGGQRALEHRRGQRVQLEREATSMSCGVNEGDGRSSASRRASQSRISLSGGRSPGKPASASCSSPQRTAELPWLRRRTLRVVGTNVHSVIHNPSCSWGPGGRRSLGGTDERRPLGQEAPDGDLARQPLLDVVVQDRRPGHHPRHDRRGLQMHQDVAARRDRHRLVAGHAVLPGHGLRGRERLRGRVRHPRG